MTGVDPETGEPYGGLVGVTEEMVATWEAAGACP